MSGRVTGLPPVAGQGKLDSLWNMDTSPTTDSAPAYDPRALDVFTGGDPTIASEIYVDFVKLGRVDLETARAALKGRDAAGLARAAHRINGSARMIGALPAADAASSVETATRNGDWAGAHAGMPEFEQLLGDLFSVLEATDPDGA